MSLWQGIKEDLRCVTKRQWALIAGIVLSLGLMISIIDFGTGMVPDNLREPQDELINPDDIDARKEYPNLRVTDDGSVKGHKRQELDGSETIELWTDIILGVTAISLVVYYIDEKSREPKVHLANSYQRK